MNKTYTIIPAKERYQAEHGWLKSYHLFSFADYYHPNNVSFWNLRVFNDDFIEWNSGFWMHPHENMEILTIVLSWEVTHIDSLWNKEITHAWEVQTMSAGSWIFHSELNESSVPLHLYQLWFFPVKKWITPCYANKKIDLKKNSLNLLFWENEPNQLNANILAYRGIYQTGKAFNYTITAWKWLFLYIHIWKIQIDDKVLEAWDQIRIHHMWVYTFTSLEENTDFIVIEVSFN